MPLLGGCPVGPIWGWVAVLPGACAVGLSGVGDVVPWGGGVVGVVPAEDGLLVACAKLVTGTNAIIASPSAAVMSTLRIADM